MSTEKPTYTPPPLFLVSHPTSEVVHAAIDTGDEKAGKETLCHVETWGEFERHADYPTEKRLCNNCSLILERRAFWKGTAFAQVWLERRRAAGTE